MLFSNVYDEVYLGIYVGEEYVVLIFKFYEIYWVYRKKYSINDEKLYENLGVLWCFMIFYRFIGKSRVGLCDFGIIYVVNIVMGKG